MSNVHELDPETQSENTPRSADGSPQVGFAESRVVEPELMGTILRVREGKLPTAGIICEFIHDEGPEPEDEAT